MAITIATVIITVTLVIKNMTTMKVIVAKIVITVFSNLDIYNGHNSYNNYNS